MELPIQKAFVPHPSVVKSITMKAGPNETANRKIKASQLSKRFTSLTSSGVVVVVTLSSRRPDSRIISKVVILINYKFNL